MQSSGQIKMKIYYSHEVGKTVKMMWLNRCKCVRYQLSQIKAELKNKQSCTLLMQLNTLSFNDTMKQMQESSTTYQFSKMLRRSFKSEHFLNAFCSHCLTDSIQCGVIINFTDSLSKIYISISSMFPIKLSQQCWKIDILEIKNQIMFCKSTGLFTRADPMKEGLGRKMLSKMDN